MPCVARSGSPPLTTGMMTSFLPFAGAGALVGPCHLVSLKMLSRLQVTSRPGQYSTPFWPMVSTLFALATRSAVRLSAPLEL